MLSASHDAAMTLGGSLHDAQEIIVAGQIGHGPNPRFPRRFVRVLDISA
jgi:hypothetical protein